MTRNGLLDVKEGVFPKHEGVQGDTKCPHLQFWTQIAVGENNSIIFIKERNVFEFQPGFKPGSPDY